MVNSVAILKQDLIYTHVIIHNNQFLVVSVKLKSSQFPYEVHSQFSQFKISYLLLLFFNVQLIILDRYPVKFYFKTSK